LELGHPFGPVVSSQNGHCVAFAGNGTSKTGVVTFKVPPGGIVCVRLNDQAGSGLTGLSIQPKDIWKVPLWYGVVVLFFIVKENLIPGSTSIT
jgi:hypothetical protein